MKAKNIFLIILLLVVGAGAIYIYPLAKLYLSGQKKINLSKKTTLYIPTDSKFDDLVDSLFEKKIIADKDEFKSWAEKRNLKDATIEPGKYLISPNMTINDLIINLRKGYGEKEVKITFNNARTNTDLAEKFTANLEIKSEDFLNTLNDPNIAQQYGFNEVTFSTMFIPNTYNSYWDISMDDLLSKMAKEYKKFWNDERKAKAKKLNLTQSEVASLASIVMCETAKSDEAPIIAGVYINRIRQRIPLQADPTLIFAIGDFTIKRVLDVHKEIDSPYNTYKYTGIPPGPIYIASPTYIDAVLDYTKHDYIYFCAKEDFSGYSNFAKTYSAHLVNARKYQNALNKRKIFK